jgi:hypothetical protein
MIAKALTVTAEIDPDRREELDRLLAIGMHLDRLPDTHFTRLVVLDDDDKEKPDFPPLLIWESNHDGTTADYLRAVAATPSGVVDAFACCRGFPDADGDVAGWLAARTLRSAAFHVAYRGRARARVLDDRKARDVIRDALDRERAALVALPAPDLHRALRDRVAAAGIDPRDRGDGGLALSRIATVAFAALVVVPLALVFALPLYLLWRAIKRAELRDLDIAYHRPVHDDARHHDREDQANVVQNQLTHVVDIKPGWVRFATVRIVLFAIDLLARVHFVHGKLGGITSIHFARWVIVPDRRPGIAREHRRDRLVFFSNYDGSWDAYLGEFIDRAAIGLTAVWSNTIGFPRTERLFFRGARDEESFKQWARDHQRPTAVWWSGVPDMTVDNIRDNAWVRDRLGRRLTDEELAEWLRRL